MDVFLTRAARTSRRRFAGGLAGAFAGLGAGLRAMPPDAFRYVLSSCMYGTMDLAEIVPEVHKIGAAHIDIWPRVHGNQREQMEAMGHDAFANLLDRHNVKLGVLTHYDLGPFGLQEEMLVARKLGAEVLICGGKGPLGLTGADLKAAVKTFAEQMRPHIDAAENAGVTIGIENHGKNLIDSPDAVKWLVEFVPSKHLGIALAPYHLEQDPGLIAGLIRDLGERMVMFYAWQHGKGSGKLAKEDELLQMPGRGALGFGPAVRALEETGYKGFVSIFMHPYPRGVPILPTAGEVTAEINRARRYLESSEGE